MPYGPGVGAVGVTGRAVVRASSSNEQPTRTRVLVVEAVTEGREELRSALDAVGFACEEIAVEADVVGHAMRSQPDAILFAPGVSSDDGLGLLAELKGERRTLLIPAIFVVFKPELVTVLALLAAGADDCIASPFDAEELGARLRVATQRRALLGGVNPLTGLPGNVWLTRAIQRHLDGGEPFAFMQVDIDNFKAFNDRYGFVLGDDVIALTAELLEAAVAHVGLSDTVLGHIGGDDFGVVSPVEHAAAIAAELVRTFDEAAPAFYDEADRARGAMTADGRDGESREFPLVSVSIGLVVWGPHRPQSTRAVADAASVLKGLAKRRRGSFVATDEHATQP